MVLKMYSVRDAKGEIFHPPHYLRSHGEAERTFHQLVKDEKSMISKFPEDYDLYYLGDYDDNTGKITPLDTPTHIAKAVQFQ